MGEETTINEFEQGNIAPLRAPRKETTAELVDERPPDVAPMPRSEDELPNNDTADR